MKTKKAVLFDLFGTLFCYGDMEKSWDEWTLSIWKNLNKLGLTMDHNEMSGHFNKFFSLPANPLRQDLSDCTKFEKRLAGLLTKFRLDFTKSNVENIADDSIKAWTRHITLDPETPQILKRLSATKKIALVSNFDHPRYVHKLLEDYDLTGYFDIITVSGEIDIDKPDPRIFRHTLRKLGIDPEEAVHIGDTDADIDGAKAAGIVPVLIDREKAVFQDSEHSTVNETAKNLNIVKPVTKCICINSLLELDDLDLNTCQPT